MDHRKAVDSLASERYLLGEMSEPERFAFEAHYFECQECAAEVLAGDALARGVRTVCKERRAAQPMEKMPGSSIRRAVSWLVPPRLIPVGASLVLVCAVLYPWLVTIPGLRTSRALSPVVLRAAARGEEQTLEVSRSQPYSLLSLDVNTADPGAPLVYEVVSPNGKVSTKGSAAAPPAGSPLIVVLSHSILNRSGAWSLVLRTSRGEEVARYPFQLKLN